MPSLTVPFDRLSRLAKVMEVLTVAGIVVITALTAACILIPDWMRNIALAKLGAAGGNLPITPLTQSFAGAVIAVPVGVMLYGLFAVRALFCEFAEGRVFTAQAARHLQTFGATVLAQAPLGPLVSTALSAVLSLGNPVGERAIMVSFSINDYFALIVGGALFAAATVMREAARLADENASFI
jgi:hypothetical protein